MSGQPQAIIVYPFSAVVASRGYAAANSDDLIISFASAQANAAMSGDVELESKPTWAD